MHSLNIKKSAFSSLTTKNISSLKSNTNSLDYTGKGSIGATHGHHQLTLVHTFENK